MALLLGQPFVPAFAVAEHAVQRPAHQRLGRARPAAPFEGRRAAHGQPVFAGQAFHLAVAPVAVAVADLHVGVAFFGKRSPRRGADAYAKAWVVGEKTLQARGQEVFGEGVGGAHAELGAAALAEQLIGAVAQGVKGLGESGQVAAANFGQAQAFGFADKQRAAEVLLQLFDLLANGGLGDVQLVGGAGEAAQAGRGFKGAQGIQWRQSGHGGGCGRRGRVRAVKRLQMTLLLHAIRKPSAWR